MKKKERLTLIEGTFKAEDAREILVNIFSAKINFHQMRNFSSLERFGKNDEIGQKRIPELKKCIEQLTAIVLEAQQQNRLLVVSSVIDIQMADAEK